MAAPWKCFSLILDSGVLVCPSGHTDKLIVATEGWSSEKSQSRMENLISSNGYAPNGVKLDAVMCSNDSTAQGVTNALVNAGYAAGSFPYITGQDCDIFSVKNMIASTQSMSVFKDTRTLANKVVEMVDAILKGSEPPINDRETYATAPALSLPSCANPYSVPRITIKSYSLTPDIIRRSTQIIKTLRKPLATRRARRERLLLSTREVIKWANRCFA